MRLRSNTLTALLVSVSLISFGLAAPIFSFAHQKQKTPDQYDSSRDSLEYHKKMYSSYRHVEFDLGGEPSRFAWHEMPGLFPHTTINHHKTRPLELALNDKINTFSVNIDDKKSTFGDYVRDDDRIDSVMILHRGKITYQAYKTHGPLDRHLSWSVTKVFTSTALARLEAMGKVNMQAPIEKYLPEFSDTAWAKLTLQDVIDMTSGIDCRDSDGYQNPKACVYRAEEALGIVPQVQKKLSSFTETLKNMSAHRAPGEETEYTSVNTNIAGLVIEAVTGKPLARAFSELLWQPMGAEADGLLTINKYGEAFASGGLSARLSDIARFGLMFFDNSSAWTSIDKKHRNALKNKPRPLFSAEVKQGHKELFGDDSPLHSSWQWDLIWVDGDMFKGGYSGQGIYVSPERELVIVWFGTADLDFEINHLLPVSRQLSRSGLF